ncbi:hypothetical protein IHE44_0010200 [Lamprotornis superbus]|uniref:Uncharacterized protein n=1 Tax=Lamprotornis superbus TaxID=245042 RepID=A0A835TLW6_9PASS|nr:hypothetical protein IHE44_0010200 [Lamprotornis superbus]
MKLHKQPPVLGYDSPCQLRPRARKELLLKQQQKEEEEEEEKRLPTHLIPEEKELVMQERSKPPELMGTPPLLRMLPTAAEVEDPTTVFCGKELRMGPGRVTTTGNTGQGPLHAAWARPGRGGQALTQGSESGKRRARKAAGPVFNQGPDSQGEERPMAKIQPPPALSGSPWLGRALPCCQPGAVPGGQARPAAHTAWRSTAGLCSEEASSQPSLQGGGKTPARGWNRMQQTPENSHGARKPITVFWMGPTILASPSVALNDSIVNSSGRPTWKKSQDPLLPGQVKEEDQDDDTQENTEHKQLPVLGYDSPCQLTLTARKELALKEQQEEEEGEKQLRTHLIPEEKEALTRHSLFKGIA